MEHFFRKILVVLFAFMIFGLLALVPVDKYQKAYMKEFYRIKSKPQDHIDNAYKYVEHIEDGGSPNSKQLNPNYHNNSNYRQVVRKNKFSPRRKPYFIRDKYNRNIIYPYRG